MNTGRPAGSGKSVLVLTMPGLGIEVLRHLVKSPAWPAADVSVALVGARPPVWRRAAAWLRHAWQPSAGRVHRLADATLCSGGAERLLQEWRLPWCWLESDRAVHEHRLVLQPALTLTITSRILFSARTLAEPPGDWLNVHPGLLPEYAGAVPAPYMFLDAVGGCSIHRMVAKLDAGTVLDRAVMPGPLGCTGGDFLFERLPSHMARRVAILLQAWSSGVVLAGGAAAEAGQPLRHCSSRRLAADRQLDWRWPAGRLHRWVRALAGIAPAWWDAGQGRRVEVAMAGATPARDSSAPGTVLACRGRWVKVACGGGALVLRCRGLPGVLPGQRLVLREIECAAGEPRQAGG